MVVIGAIALMAAPGIPLARARPRRFRIAARRWS
jgi:hypothetical protein